MPKNKPVKQIAKRREGSATIVLLAGQSRTDRKSAATAITGRLGPGLLRVDLAAIVSKYVGATEKHIDALFDAAEAGGNALFLDEADAVFGKRSEVKDSHDRYANIAAAAILRRLRSFDGIAILASKTKEVGSTLLRQADFVVDLPKASNARSGSGR